MKLEWALAAMVAVGSLAGSASAGNMILNGSFEDNTAVVTTYNLNNPVFNGLMNNVTAFGERDFRDGFGETDIMTFGGGFGLDPVDGDWHIGLAVNGREGPSDAFSFDLSSSIVAGTSYDLSFWAAANTTFSPGDGPLEIGISSSADSFGTLLYTSDALSFNRWSQHVTSLVAPVGGDYLTVRILENPDDPITWAHLDGFVLSVVPEPGTLAMLGLFSLFGFRRRCSA